LKIFKGKSIYAAINRLKNANLVKEELKIKSRVRERKDKKTRDPLKDIIPQAVLHKPAPEQAAALNAISCGLKGKAFAPFLLYGVTGSGKTLVYLKALEQAVSLGKQAIFLVPEISLTSWPVKYVTAIFPGRVAVIHSGLSDGERYDEWKRIRDGEADVVVGARSAIFAPLKNLGLIIVDEEHEPSYKQEEGVRYNARDLSLMMGKMLDLAVVLGSATPSIETFYNAQNGKIMPLHLMKRVEDRPMPAIEVVDMKKDGDQGNKKGIISERLRNLMIENHGLGYQTILFLNRRGFSNFLICNDCGNSFKCLNCSVSLTMHKRAGLLKCHYCDMSMAITDTCPKCHGCNVKPIGIGTEQLEEDVRKILNAGADAPSPLHERVSRMDKDTTTKRKAHQKILDAVDRGDVDVLVGTQMVAKGHHFPNVTLVGIVSADTSVNIPDFRSSERTFQLITQAGGRAGRGNIPGKVVIQTLNPDHFCLKLAANHNYEYFFRAELNNRKELSYPPFSRLAIIRFDGNKEEEVAAFAKKTKEFADSPLLRTDDVTLLGPTPAILSKLKGKSLHEFIKNILTALEKKSQNRVKLEVDIDPITTI
jgi:primosomal protein N' (replication factor Y) (superfamily II helicase)